MNRYSQRVWSLISESANNKIVDIRANDYIVWKANGKVGKVLDTNNEFIKVEWVNSNDTVRLERSQLYRKATALDMARWQNN